MKRTSVLAGIMLIVLVACNHKGPETARNNAIKNTLGWADSLFTDGSPRDTVTEFILSDTAYVYTTDTSGLLYPAGILHMGDSIRVIEAYNFNFYNLYYRALKDTQQVLIKGTDLGQMLQTDFDADGKDDKIYYGYTDYDTVFSPGSDRMHPTLYKFIAANGHRFEIRDSGYSELDFEEVNVGKVNFNPPLKFYEAGAGYPACGYSNYKCLIATYPDKVEKVTRYAEYGDAPYANYYQISFPVDSTHRSDTIIMYHMETQDVEGFEDSVKDVMLDSQLVYKNGGQWKVEKMKVQKN